MSGAGAALSTAAASLIGTRFRLHGRDPHRGLDCVGVIAASLAAVGRTGPMPNGYRLRSLNVERELSSASALGLRTVEGPILPGDVLLVRPGPAQFHLLVAAQGGGFIHAHAALGRVTHSPGPLAWPVERHWRLFAD